MKNILLFLVLSLVALTMGSCSPKPFYQVCKITSDQLSSNPDGLVYENEDCKLSYNFFSSGGNLSFSVKNKTDRMLYLVMPESFYIRNEIAYDYYSDATVVNSVTNGNINGTSFGDRYTNISINNATLQANSHSVEKREPKIIGIPPYAVKFIERFSIMKEAYLTRERKLDYPKKTSSFSFSESNSPVSFTNRIAYSFDSEGTELKCITNDFYISNITNYSFNKARRKSVEKNYSVKKQMHYSFSFEEPDRFYIQYGKPGFRVSDDFYELVNRLIW